MINANLLALATCAAVLVAPGCGDDDDLGGVVPDVISTPERVVIENQPGLYPEGIDYSDDRDAFVVTSVTTGQLGLVDDDGNYTVLNDGDGVISAIGVLVDDERDRILVASSDAGGTPASTPATAMRRAELVSYGQEGATIQWRADLAALNGEGDSLSFANDVAVDANGDAYVTNSFSPYIYRVDEDGSAEVFLRDERFAAPAGAFGLNGIVETDGYLIVAHSANRALYRVSIADTSDVQVIALSDSLAEAPDGLELVGEDLAVISNAAGVVVELESDDDWASATQVNSYAATLGEFPTTGVERGGELFVLYAYLNQLFVGNASQATYEIERFDF